MVGQWLANGWAMAGQWLANGWPMVGQWLAPSMVDHQWSIGDDWHSVADQLLSATDGRPYMVDHAWLIADD